MNGSEISKDWTDKERLEVVGRIAKEMNEARMTLSYHMTVDWTYRLALLAGATAEFLELNRENILGQKVKR